MSPPSLSAVLAWNNLSAACQTRIETIAAGAPPMVDEETIVI